MPSSATEDRVGAEMSVEDKCYKCRVTQSTLLSEGRQLYTCDMCGKDCCSEHSHDWTSEVGAEVICDDCHEGDGA